MPSPTANFCAKNSTLPGSAENAPSAAWMKPGTGSASSSAARPSSSSSHSLSGTQRSRSFRNCMRSDMTASSSGHQDTDGGKPEDRQKDRAQRVEPVGVVAHALQRDRAEHVDGRGRHRAGALTGEANTAHGIDYRG